MIFRLFMVSLVGTIQKVLCSAILFAMSGTDSFLHYSWVAFLLMWQETRGLHTGRGGQRRYCHMKQPGEGLSRPELWLTASRWSRPLPLNPGWAQDVGRRCPTLSNPTPRPLPRASHSNCQAPGNESKYANWIISTLHVRGRHFSSYLFYISLWRHKPHTSIPQHDGLHVNVDVQVLELQMYHHRQKRILVQESIKTLC